MKRTLFVVAIATVLVFAFSGVAMAKITNGYVSWDDAVLNLDGTDATPHIGYTVNTEKCMVCHSVHNAAVSGTAWTGTNPWTARDEETEMLLRSNVANACVYCHISTDVGGVQLYEGNETLWTDPASLSTLAENAAHNRTSANCVNCHAVHGANTYQGAVASKILKFEPAKIQDEILGYTDVDAATVYVSADGDGATTGLYASALDAQADTGALGKDYQVSVFCTQCHQNYSYASEDVINTDGDYVYGDSTYVDGDATANKQYKTHPMKAASTTFTASGDNFGGQAAFVASTTCRSCHDAGETDQSAGVTSSNFPHYTAGAFSFVNVAADYQSYSTAAASGLDHGSDGMCLKCHASSNAGEGVGDAF
jgi:hypothetical protein